MVVKRFMHQIAMIIINCIHWIQHFNAISLNHGFNSNNACETYFFLAFMQK